MLKILTSWVHMIKENVLSWGKNMESDIEDLKAIFLK